jgi:hypothetical protein
VVVRECRSGMTSSDYLRQSHLHVTPGSCTHPGTSAKLHLQAPAHTSTTGTTRFAVFRLARQPSGQQTQHCGTSSAVTYLRAGIHHFTTTPTRQSSRRIATMGLSYNVYLNSSCIYACKNCKTHLSNRDDILSRVSLPGRCETERRVLISRRTFAASTAKPTSSTASSM